MKMSSCCLMLALTARRAPDEGEDRREDALRNEEGCGVVDPDLWPAVSPATRPWGASCHADQAEAHEDGAGPVDDRHAEVAGCHPAGPGPCRRDAWGK